MHTVSGLLGFTCPSSLEMNEKFPYCARLYTCTVQGFAACDIENLEIIVSEWVNPDN